MAKYIPETKQSLSTRGAVGVGRGRGRGRGKVKETAPGLVSRVDKSNYNLRRLPDKNYCENDSSTSIVDDEIMEVHASMPNKESKIELSPTKVETPKASIGQVKGKGSGRGRGRGRAKLLSPVLQIQERGENSPYNLRQLKVICPEEISVDTKVALETMETPHKVQSLDEEFIESDKEEKKLSSKHPNFVFFWKTASPFSQFHPACFSVRGDNYLCAEQYMMSSKARLFRDEANLRNIMGASDPKKMKHFGRQVENFAPDVWNLCCRQIVQEGNRAKFSQNKHLLKLLFDTNDKYFVEASPFDRIWGIGMGASNSKVFSPGLWKGSNWLGEALNQVKIELQLIVHSSMNEVRDTIYQDTMIYELFKIGLCDKFDKMKCEIEISDDEKEKYTDLTNHNKKSYKHLPQKNKKQASNQKTISQFFPTSSVAKLDSKDKDENFEISELEKDFSNTENFVSMMEDWDSELIDEKSTQNSDCVTEPEIMAKPNKIEETNQNENTSQENQDEGVLVTPDVGIGRKETSAEEISPNQDLNNSSLLLPSIDDWKEELISPTPESGIFSQFNEVSLQDQLSDNENPISLIPHSKIAACGYIFADWAREKLLNNPDALTLFINLNKEKIQNIPGFCVYKSDDQLIAPSITLSHILIQLHTEFDEIKNSILAEKELISRYTCAHILPSRPQKYNLHNVMAGPSLLQDSDFFIKNNEDKTTNLNVKSGKKSKKNKKITTEQKSSPDTSSMNSSGFGTMDFKSSPIPNTVEPSLPEAKLSPILSTHDFQSEMIEDFSEASVDSILKRSNSDSKRSSESATEYFTADEDIPSPKLKESKIAKKGNSKGKKKGKKSRK